MKPVIAVLGLSGAELILIFLVLALVVITPAIVALILFLVLRRKPAGPPPVVPPRPPPGVCPQCGAPLSAAAPEGLCPACLLQHGIATDAPPAGQPPFTPPPFHELAKLFPQLEILELIGKGGMGAVYKARQPALERFVALKVLAPRSGSDADFTSRFTREARALAKLSHPNIVGVFDFGHVSGLNYFLMEYVDGPNLRQLQQAGRLAPAEALAIIPQICAALQFAHEEGIVHRDIKPENVLLDKKGHVKIADFGLAKIVGQGDFRLTGARDVMGTPHYMAPEQVERPQDVDHRADIYSLGVVFYEMLTGELPLGKFQAPSQKVRVDVRLDEVVLRALAKEPERRYQQASEVKTQVETILGSPGAPASPASPEPPRTSSTLRNAFDVLAAVLLLAGGSAAYWFGVLFNALYCATLAAVPVGIVRIGAHLFSRSLETRLWRQPFAPELRRHRWQVLNRWIFWLLAGLTLKLCIVPAQFPPEVYVILMRLVWGAILLLMLFALLPGKQIYPATNLAVAAASLFIVAQLVRIHWPVPASSGVVLAAPFRGDWLVINGGRSELINVHYRAAFQRDAVDLERIVNGRETTDDWANLSSYASWNETVYAPADGKVVRTLNDIEDHPLQRTDLEHSAGNLVIIDLGGSRYVLLAHLQKDSVLVHVGDVVHTGQPIAKVGNSGHTSHPHLHLQVQNQPDFYADDLRTFPILFRDVICLRGDAPRGDAPFSVRRNDRIVARRSERPAVSADGLVSRWSAEDNAEDATGNNDGVLASGAGFAPGRAGRAFNFAGGGQKVLVADSASLKLTNALTIEGWVYARGPGFVLIRGDSRAGLDPYSLVVDGEGYVSFNIDSSANQRAGVRGRLPLNQWKHVAATFDAASGAIRLFIDGAPVAERATILRPLSDLDPRFEPGLGIGGHPGSDNFSPFDGMIDELSLYSRALTGEEIQAHYRDAATAGAAAR